MASAGENLNASQVWLVLWRLMAAFLLFHKVLKTLCKIIFNYYCFVHFCFQFYITLRDDLDYLDGKHTVSILCILALLVSWGMCLSLC